MKNILVYCQHVLGIGHLCRILLILRQLAGQRVTLVLGGPQLPLQLPDHVRTVQLPGLRMDEEFSDLLPVDNGKDVATIKEQRSRQLTALFNQLQPDLLLVELFPFGRNGFRFELLPLLREAEKAAHCMVACSVRDILVERDNVIKFEQRVIDHLNQYFQLLLIHGDPELIRLDETFSRMKDIHIPISYTGYICQPPRPDDRTRLRNRLQLGEEDRLIVVSAGSGSVGTSLVSSAVDALACLAPDQRYRMHVFTGPYMEDSKFRRLASCSNDNLVIQRFSQDFPAWLAAADLSLSMGGYNTTMNLIAAGCRGLIYPFSQNHEQRLRAERLGQRGLLQLLSEKDLHSETLAEIMKNMVSSDLQPADIMLDGAARTAQLLLAPPRGDSRS